MKKSLFAIILALLLFPVSSRALIPRAVFPKPQNPQIRSIDRWNLLVVKFIEGSQIRLRNGHLTAPQNFDLSGLNHILSSHPETRIERLFQRPEEEYELEKASGEAACERQLADLNLYYAFGPKDLSQARELLAALNNLPIVEIAYAEVRPIPASISAPSFRDTPSFVDLQDYLEDSPVGVNAYSAWAHVGGKGQNVHFVDVELCWNWDHEDLPAPFFTAGTPDAGYIDHGTAVMGEIAGRENAYGITGIAPEVTAGGVAIALDDYPESVGTWFDVASAAISPGDVWLIELHAPGPDSNYICMEYWQANYDAIANSTANGRICVEAGGNGTADLDSALYEGKFDRSIRDSLAILVGAGTPYEMAAEYFSNYGSRMDANGWGSEIFSTGYGDYYAGSGINQWYTSAFGGTSGASPMIVGVCCDAQSIYKELTHGDVLDPETLRAAITETGAPQPTPIFHYIGPRPDLEALLMHPIFQVNGIDLDKTSYRCEDIISITVRDDSLPPEAIIAISSETEPAGELLELPQMEPGVFQGSLFCSTIPATPGDGILSVADGNTITAVYAALPDSDFSGVDCMIPVISNVAIQQITDTSVIITWQTNEPADSRIRYGTSLPDQIFADADVVTDHSLTIPSLEACTHYFFQVESADPAGNLAVDDHAGEYYEFMTWIRLTYFYNELDTDPGWLISGGEWAFGQPQSAGGEHGGPDPSSGHTGSNVYGYNLSGDYGINIPEYHLTSNPIDLSAAEGSTLHFWRWLGVEQPAYDHAYVRISTNGVDWTDVWTNTVEVADTSWTHMEYDISQWADGQPEVYLRWTMGSTDGSWVYCGWNIDDVEIDALRSCDATPTPPNTATPTSSQPTSTRTPTGTPPATASTPPAPTSTPTQLPSSTGTPSITPTNTLIPPSPTPSPAPSSPSPTPSPTGVTPSTPTPGCSELGVTINMPSHHFNQGDPCSLRIDLCNPGATLTQVPIFVILDVYGHYFFAPSWRSESEGIDFYHFDAIPSGLQEIEVIPEFSWPENVGSASGLIFFAAMTDANTSYIQGTFGSWEFGY
jgi:serine protease